MKKILIVEDELLVAKSYALFLKKAGYEVLPGQSDGVVAAECFPESGADVVLMDVHLKNNTSGLEAAKKIRAMSDVFIIFTTGNAIRDAEEESAQISNSIVLTKPVEPALIDRAIRNYFSDKPASSKA